MVRFGATSRYLTYLRNGCKYHFYFLLNSSRRNSTVVWYFLLSSSFSLAFSNHIHRTSPSLNFQQQTNHGTINPRRHDISYQSGFWPASLPRSVKAVPLFLGRIDRRMVSSRCLLSSRAVQESSRLLVCLRKADINNVEMIFLHQSAYDIYASWSTWQTILLCK